MAQNYKNHRQVVYKYYVLTLLPWLALVAGSITLYNRSEENISLEAVLFFLVCAILLSLMFHSRAFALKAQDRAIRAEENLRHFALTGKLLDQRLRLSQVIALRFASDAELPELSALAAEEGLASDEIKKRIQSWRADTYRV